jgi:uncharacterized membrane protein YkvA (DUF1232 family)
LIASLAPAVRSGYGSRGLIGPGALRKRSKGTRSRQTSGSQFMIWCEGLVKVLTKFQGWSKAIKRDIVAIWIARKDPRLPWYVKFAAAVVAAYALSPIDLIPDFIPVLGYLDDLIVVPLGILLVVQMIPPRLMLQFREEARRRVDIRAGRAGVMMIFAMWVAAFGLTIWAMT